MGLMGKMDLVLGMRLHSLIFSVIQGVPSVGISYDPKVKNLMEMVSLPWVDVSHFTKDDLTNAVEKVYCEREKIREGLPGRTEILRERSCRNFELLKGLLDK
jgi:polysaccharide pyruvyl transferase WcaK-like protein